MKINKTRYLIGVSFVILCLIIASLLYQQQKATVINLEKLEMSIKSYDKNTIVLEIKNDTNVEWLYGGEYEIQKMIFQDDWLPLEFSGVFNLIGYPLEENDVKEVEINFEYGYGELEPGVYCISKGFSLWDDNLRKEQTVEIVKYCTFEIK